MSPAVSQRGHSDHASSPRLLQTLQQQRGQQEVTQVVDSELDTETVICPAISHQTCRTEALACTAWRWRCTPQLRGVVSCQPIKSVFVTSVVDEQIQPGARPQEMLTEAVDGLQVGQV